MRSPSRLYSTLSIRFESGWDRVSLWKWINSPNYTWGLWDNCQVLNRNICVTQEVNWPNIEHCFGQTCVHAKRRHRSNLLFSDCFINYNIRCYTWHRNKCVLKNTKPKKKNQREPHWQLWELILIWKSRCSYSQTTVVHIWTGQIHWNLRHND
jgi:hypothetical protein